MSTQDWNAISQSQLSSKPRIARKVTRKPRKAGMGKVQRKSVAAICRQVIQSQAEVKSIQTNGAVSPRNFLDTTANYVGANVFMVSPNNDLGNVVQGTGPAQRIGNEIRVKKATMDIILYPKPYSVSVNPNPRPCIVTFWCVSPKTGYESASDMAAVFDSFFFQAGGSTDGYAFNLTDVVRAVNTDILTVHWKRCYKLGHATHYAQPNQATEPYPSNVQFANNDYKMNQIIKFDFTKHIQKTIKYNDTSSVPMAKTLFLICSIARADGSTFSSASDLPVDMWYQHNLEFTDI